MRKTRTEKSKTHKYSNGNAFCDFVSRFVLKGFASYGRDLTDKETKAFLKAADKDGDGKIGIDGKHNPLFCLYGSEGLKAVTE